MQLIISLLSTLLNTRYCTSHVLPTYRDGTQFFIVHLAQYEAQYNSTLRTKDCFLDPGLSLLYLHQVG